MPHSDSLISAPPVQTAPDPRLSAPSQQTRSSLARYGWRFGCAAVLLIALALRFYKLELKPLHNDEGVNAFFFLRLFQENVYRYDPANYHGPTLYYFALLATSVSTLFLGERGVTIFALRSVSALFGVATIFLIFYLRRYLGTPATLSAAALLAVSPGAVYFSRDFIHEPILAFFTLAIVLAGLRFYEDGNAKFAVMVAVITALLFATKETAPLSFGVLALALATTTFWRTRAHSSSRPRVRDLIQGYAMRFGGGARLTRLLLACTAMFVVLWVIFYSSFFGNFQALHDAFTALKIWANTGTSAHRHPVFTYFVWLGKEEWPLLVLGTLGTLIAVVRRKPFPLFAGLWSFGLILAYSLIPYKTPWLTLNFLAPLALASGYAVTEVYAFVRLRSQAAARVWITLIVAALAISVYNSWQLNFYRYDDDHYPYVYAQTRRGILDLVRKINTISQQNGTGSQTSIAIMSPDYWPLPWYLRDYSRVGYFSKITHDRTDIVIASHNQSVEVEGILGADYTRVGEYPLRPGVNLVAFARSTKSAAE